MRTSALLFLALAAGCSRSSSGDGAAPSPVSSASYPPSGRYAAKIEVVSSTCTPAPPTVDQDDLLVLVRHTPSRHIVNLPLVVAPASSGAPVVAVARTDVDAKPGATIDSKLHPDSRCPAFELERAVEVTELSHDRIRVKETTTYGDGTSCKTETLATYTLTKGECEAPCNARTTTSIPDGGKPRIDVTCVCP